MRCPKCDVAFRHPPLHLDLFRLQLPQQPRVQGFIIASATRGDAWLALGTLQVLRERGVAAPQQVSVVGHNDIPLLDQISPPLTTVRIQHSQIGFRAAQLLLDALDGSPGSDAATVMLRPELVVRSSTPPPP